MLKLKLFGFLIAILVLGFIPLTGNPFGINENDKIFNNVFFLIYNQQFGDAEKELVFSQNKLNHLEYYVLNLDLLWWKAVVNDNENDFGLLEKKLNTTIDELEKLSNRDKFEELVCLNYLFRLATKKNQPLKMIHYFLKINKTIEQLDIKGLAPENTDVFNLYKAIFSYGKSKILFFNPKPKNESLITLKSYQFSSSPANQTIANYFLAKIYNEIEKSPDSAKPYYERLCKLYPNNKVFKKDLSLINKKLNSEIKH